MDVRKLGIAAVICCIAALTFLFAPWAYAYIDSGKVGVRVNASGPTKGIDPNPIGVGRVWFNPLWESIHEFPIYEQNVKWIGADSFIISSSQSAQISVDVNLTFQLEEKKVPHMFGLLRRDIDYISSQWLQTHVREGLSRAAETMDTMSILGDGKSELLDKAKTKLNKDLIEYGLSVKILTFASTPRPESKIQAAIDLTIQAEQSAKQAQAKIVQSKAEADQVVETMRGKVQTIKLEAEAKLIAAESEAKANHLISESLTPQLVQTRAIERWDGILPKFTGGITPILDIQSVK